LKIAVVRAFSDAQCLRRATRDRQLVVCLRAQLDFRILARTFDVVRDGTPVSNHRRRGEYRYARVITNVRDQRVALGRPERRRIATQTTPSTERDALFADRL